MIVRLRSRDGLERIEVADGESLMGLKLAINQKLNIPMGDMQLSKRPELLTSKEPETFQDLNNDAESLKALGIAHGEMLFMLYHIQRDVEPAYKKGLFESRPFGERVTMADVMAKQTRVERQEKGTIESVSIDTHAADGFQSYVQRALSFGIKRGGLMYGRVEEGNKVVVDFIYEPPQEGSANHLNLQRQSNEEAQVEFLAGLLGYKKVGWIFSQSKQERDFIMHTGEVMQTAAMQDELGETCATVMVSWEKEGGQVHFEAFQCTEQCVQLSKDGWMVPIEGDEVSGVTKMRNPKRPDVDQAIIVGGKDADECDNDYFLCPVAIASHDGLMGTSFPVENRLLPQGKAELREHLKSSSSKSYVERLTDFHLLLWLSKQPNLDPNDMMLLCDAVKEQKPVLEGYRVIIDSVAGI